MKSKYILYFSFLIFSCLTLFFSKIPFFWDATMFSQAAINFLDNISTPFDFPAEIDNVTFPIYSTYLFVVWKLFSKSLLISHLAMLPFLLGICNQFYRLSKKYLNETFVSFSLILLIIQPTFLTQSILMSYDIIVIYLFLLLVNLFIEDKKKWYILIAPLLGLYSIRGILLLGALASIQFFLLYPKHKFKSFSIVLKQHLFSIILISFWLFFHYFKTGWIIISPLHENTDEHLVSFTMMIRQFVYLIWKLIDFGQLILWLFLIFTLLYFYKKNQFNNNFKTILTLLVIPTFITMAIMIPLSNPISHRYFMFTFILLIITVCYLLQQIENKKLVTFFMFLFIISLASGNFWLYPERFGNGWDTSLKVLPYFELKEKMDNYIQQNNIDKNKIGTQFPLTANTKYSHLTAENFQYNDVENEPSNYNYFLQSNIVNTAISEQVEAIKKNWILLKKFEMGQVYISLYQQKN